MDSLDSMFVPYKDLLYPKSEVAKPKTSWLWIIVVIAIGSLAAYFLFFKDSKKPLYNLLPMTASETTPVIDLKSIPNIVSSPPLKDIPKTINLIRGGQKEVYASPTEFARQVGTAIKETLVTFPQMNAPLLTSIVQCAVKSVLASQKETVESKENVIVKKESEAPATKSITNTNISPPDSPPKKKEGKLSIANLPTPIIDEEEVESDAGKKQTKINAESNPYVIQMMKQRGLDKHSTE
jgi:hypothetical protein